MRVVRRDESRVIDSVKEITVDRRPPRVTLLSAEPSVVATGLPGETPSVRLRYRGPKNKAPVFRVFRTDDGKPHIVRRFRGGPNRDRRLGRPGEQRPAADGARAGGRLRVHGRACATAPATSPRRRSRCRAPRWPRPGTGVSVRRFTLRGPLSAVTAGAFAHLEVGPVDRSFDWVVSRLGRPQGRAARRSRGRPLPHPDPEQDQDRRLPRPRAGGEQRAVWPLAVAGLPPKERPRPGAPAGRAARAHLAGTEPRGRRRRRLRRPPAVRAAPCGSTAHSPTAALPPRFDERGVAAPALARPRAARPMTSPPTSRSRAARARPSATPRAWPSPAASSGRRSS